MKKLMMMIAAMMLTASSVSAQSTDTLRQRKPDRGEIIEYRTARMADELGLNDSQRQQLLELNKAYAGKMPRMGGAHRHFGGPRGGQPIDSVARPQRPSKEEIESRMKERKQNEADYEVQLKKILTSEQYAKYQENKQRRLQRGGMGGPGRGRKYGGAQPEGGNDAETK